MDDRKDLFQIRSSKVSLIFLLFVSILWLLFIFLMLKGAPLDAAFGGGVLIGFINLISIVLSVMFLMRPNLLLVDTTGITQTAMGRVRHWSWRDVANFRVMSMSTRNIGPGGSFVVFDDLRTGAGVAPAIRNLWLRNSLMSGWTMGPKQLAAFLNARRAEWATTMGKGSSDGD